MPRISRPALKAAAIVAMGSAVAPARAEVFTSSGLTFVAVRDAGNRGALDGEAPLWPAWASPLGAVDHEFGIMRTNIDNAEWIEFVRAYAPYYPGSPSDNNLTGRWVRYLGMVGGQPRYEVVPGAEHVSAEPTWRVAARYANWLHNGRSLQPAAFENGAYDTSTFGEVMVGGQTMLTDQRTHHPDARFWLPTVDEYTKGAHWDPDKFGPGQGGYWLMPNGGDANLIAGPPGVGQAAGNSSFGPIVLGSYPDTQSPWGMWDVSSTYMQMTEGYVHPATGTRRLAVGSDAGSAVYWLNDRLDTVLTVGMGGNFAFRLATPIPAPASVAVLGLGWISCHRRRRTCNGAAHWP